MKNMFELTFKDKSLSCLSGNTYGRKIFKEQLYDTINYDVPIHIVFPKYISSIGSSFIQGFFAELVSRIGIEGINESVTITTQGAIHIGTKSITDAQELKEYFIKCLSL